MKHTVYPLFLYTWLVLLITATVVFAGEQPVDFMVDVGHGVLPHVQGLCSYNALREYYKKVSTDNNVYCDSVFELPLQGNDSVTVQHGWYGQIKVNGAQSSWGSGQFSRKHNRPWYNPPSFTRVNLFECNTQELLWYFLINDYSAETILDQQLLYMSDAFVALAKQIPGYESKIRALAYFWGFQCSEWDLLCAYIQGKYVPGFADRLRYLRTCCDEDKKQHDALVSAQEAQKAQEVSRCIEEERWRKQREYGAKIDLCKARCDSNVVLLSHQHARDGARTELHKTLVKRVERAYVVHSDVVSLANRYGLEASDFTIFFGNAYEHQLHKEFLEQLDAMHHIVTCSGLREPNILIDVIGDSVALGIEANKMAQVEAATTWADVGWQLLHIVAGVGDGVMESLSNNFNMVLHPYDTVIQTSKALNQMLQCFFKAVITLMRWDLMIELKKHNELADEMSAMDDYVFAYRQLCAQELAKMNARQVAKTATTAVVDCILLPKMLTKSQVLCERVAPIIKEVSIALKERGLVAAETFMIKMKESPVLQTAEGIVVTLSENAGKMGGAIGEMVCDAQVTLEMVHAHYMSQMQAEWASLKPMFDNTVKGVGELANKYIKIDGEHIFGIVFDFKEGKVNKIKGFHHDFMQSIEKSGVIEFTNKVMYKEGFYTVKVGIGGMGSVKSFFPADWPRKKVIKKIYEAYENYIKNEGVFKLENDGKYKFVGYIVEGIEIEIVMRQNGKILTAYPILK